MRVPKAALRLALAIAVLVICGNARASLVSPLTVEEMSAVSDDIVLATVTSSESEIHGGKIITRHELAVKDVAKGSAPKSGTMTLYTLGGKIGPVGSMAPGMATLEKNEEVVLFLENPRQAVSKAKAAGARVDETSPLNTSPMIVGGFQGKFNVVSTKENHDVPGGKSLEIEKERVFRGTPGRTVDKGSMPTVDEFMSALKTLNSKSLPIRKTTRTVASRQDVEVPAADPNAKALRAFDPVIAPPAPDNLKLVGKVKSPAAGAK